MEQKHTYIDFLLGKITRLHSDIDLVTWIQHREHLEQALVSSGFQIKPEKKFTNKEQEEHFVQRILKV
ncbi:hypothetical protein FC682_26360 [Peribacillus simplex]|uniref:nucleotidyltransferase domain-containing protein n=1 Tax=Peribacillus simplex TaxID=1478 RepID=UPI0010BEC834|nr:hypothetical protein FC682_26360 [Peribacillus simplex]